jgi:hypothetical protein
VRRQLLLVLVLAAGLLSACRLDVDVAVTMDADGSGSVRVRAVADAELVAAEPGVVEGLAVDDLRAVGWTVTGPDSTPDGGAVVTLDHRYDDAAGLAALLRSIGAPLLAADVVRELNIDSTEATNTLSASLGLPEGPRSFSDDALVEALGAEPFAEVLADGTPLADRLTFTLTVLLPGEITAHDGDEITTESGAQGLRWSAPLDGSTATISATSLQSTATGGSWAEPIATAARIALVVWVAISGSFILWVIMARRRRARRRSSTASDPRVR